MPVDRLVGALGGGLFDDAIARALGAVQPSPEAVIGQDMMQQDAMQAPTSFPTPQDLMNDRQRYQFGMDQPLDGQARPDFPVGVDRIGAERGTPDLSEVPAGAPQDPYPGVQATPPPPDPYAPLGSPQTTQQATTQANDQMVGAAKAQSDLELAKQAALRAQQMRISDVYQRSADEQLLYMNEYKQERAAIQAKADVETAAWLQDLQNVATREPNPNRAWRNKSGLGRAMWALSMVFGAVNAAVTPGGKSAALEMVQKEIDRDMADQRALQDRELKVKQTEGSSMQARHARNMLDSKDDYTAKMTRLQSLERAWMAKATAPGDQDAAVAKQAGLAWLAEQKSVVAERYRQEKAAQDERLAAQRHQERMAGAQRAFQREQAAAERAFADQQRQAREAHDIAMENLGFGHKLVLSPVDIGLGAGSKNNPTGKDGKPMFQEVQSGVLPGGGANHGIVLLDPTGKPAKGDGVLRTDDQKKHEEAGKIIENANTRYTATKELLDLLEGEGNMAEAIVAGTVNPEVSKRIKALGYAIAQSQNKQVTNQDYSSGVAQAVGFDPDGDWLSRSKFALNINNIKDGLRKDLNAMPKYVSEQLQKYNDQAINGQSKVVWDPRLLSGDVVREKNARELRGEGPTSAAITPVTGAADYRKRMAAEAADPERRGSELPAHFASVIDTVLAESKGRGAAAVRKSADAARADLKAREVKAQETLAATAEGTPERDAALRQLNAINETRDILDVVSEDVAAKAVKTLESLKERVRFVKGLGMTEDNVRNIAGKAGIADEAEVKRLIDEFRNYTPPKRPKTFFQD